MSVVHTSNLGFPRMGDNRQLKRAIESFWAGKSDETVLQQEAQKIRETNWKLQQKAGIEVIPSNDFSFYDQVLDTSFLFRVIPERYKTIEANPGLRTYFAMARGDQKDGVDVSACEMRKWFDSNYHYIVPELESETTFALANQCKPIDEYLEARAHGIETRPVLLGLITFLLIGRSKNITFDPLTLLDRFLPVYEALVRRLAEAGVKAIQIDEPCLVLDLSPAARNAFTTVYARLRSAAAGVRLTLATYFGELGDNLETAVALPVDELHIDLVRAPQQLKDVLAKVPAALSLSLGVVNGRNIWKIDLDSAVALVRQAVTALGADRVRVGPSCSLLHSPHSLASERALNPEVLDWLSFATEKLDEIVLIARIINEGETVHAAALESNRASHHRRRESTTINNPAVAKRVSEINEAMSKRTSPYPQRSAIQRAKLNLPLLPTTTIGSFPQTNAVRQMRASFTKGTITSAEYEAFLETEMLSCIRLQESLGLDVLVHGEFERNDMVEYFGEHLSGYVFTQNGWVQSFGTRCVKPPIIFGDISRPKAMTVEYIKKAQAMTTKPMKGMLTGPITMMQWSFVRDDQQRSVTAFQLALAIRDEVADLEAAGIPCIQVDEPAIREGLPLRQRDQAAYLDWAVKAFRLATCVVSDATQIHSHLCYSDFNQIIEAVAAMDADVLTIENAKSDLKLLEAFTKFKYPNELGPGLFDIHSPRIPPAEEMKARLTEIIKYIPIERVWVAPDCGLKTRRWEEVESQLTNLVICAKIMREIL